MSKRKSKNATKQKINPQAEALADLPLTGEQAEDSKAGGGRQQEYLTITMKDVLVTSYQN